MTERECFQAAEALISWFESQGIIPPEAAIVMSTVVARALVGKTNNKDELTTAIRLHGLLLACDVSRELHNVG